MNDGRRLPVHLDAAALVNMTARQVTLQSLSGTWRGVEMALKAPAIVNYADGLSLDRLTAGLVGGDITASGELLPRLQLSVSAQGIALSNFKSFTPNGTAQGTISGSA